MSVTLSTALFNALDSSRHHPIAKIISSQLTSEFPLVGTRLRPSAVTEIQPQMFTHSSGRLMTFWIEGGLMMAYTDIERTAWTNTGPIGGIQAIGDFAAIELDDGNIGIVWMLDYSGYNSGYMGMWGTSKVTVTGATVTNSFRYVVASTQLSPKLYPSICRTSTGFLLTYEEIVNPGGGYYIRRQTLDDATFMGAWSSISTITLNYPMVDTVIKGYPNVTTSESGQIVLVFDYRYDYQSTSYKQDLYYCLSNDDGVTFSTPAKFTNYNSYSEGAEAPNTAFCQDGNLVVAFHRKASVVNIGMAATGWNTADPANGYEIGDVRDIHFDSASGLLFVVIGRESMGSKSTMGAIVIDPETFQVVKCYNSYDSSPKFDIWFTQQHNIYGTQAGYSGEGQYMVFGGGFAKGICLINHQTETITEYYFDDCDNGRLLKNIEIGDAGLIGKTMCCGLDLDVEAGRLYVLFYDSYFWHPTMKYGYIDITEPADVVTGMYSWYDLNTFAVPDSGAYYCWLEIFKNEGYALIGLESTEIVNTYNPGHRSESGFFVLQLETGIVIKRYINNSNPGFPYNGAYGGVVLDNKVYLGIGYITYNDSQDRRGLCIIDLLTDTITYERPTYSTEDNYELHSPLLIENDTKILWTTFAGSGGIVEYDIANHTWRKFDGETHQGLISNAMHVAYDSTNNTVFQGNYGNGGVYIYTPQGSFYTAQYIVGTPGTPYVWGAISQLAEGQFNQLPAVICDDRIYTTWLNENPDTGLNYIDWARSGISENVVGQLVKDQPLSISWEVDRPARATFTLANGHLYDPTNTLSLLSNMFKKHRIVTIELGELTGGVEYFSSQGKFLVTGTELRINKTVHPTITITCEDRGTMWDEVIVSATENYGGSSFASIMQNILEDVVNLQNSEYSIPSFTNFHNLYAQWIDESLYDIIDQLSNHFGMFPYWDHNGIFTFKRFDLSASPSHFYVENGWVQPTPPQMYSRWPKIVEWSPEDSNLSYVNRVTVKTESHVTHEVIYPEERVCSMSGTCGWWGGKRDKIIWYSDDRMRTMRYPRLVIVLSVGETMPYSKLLGPLAGGSESITEVDIDEHWCEVTIEQPDMSEFVFGIAAILIIIGASAVECDGFFTGTCWLFIMTTNFLLSTLVTVLSGVASYEYEIYARPLGKVKQMIQATANDEDFQRDLNGQVIEHTFEDTLCYEVEHCEMVSQHEIDIVHAQRNRVRLKKICHLRDELGDIISFYHPINRQTVKLFIAKLTRTFTYGDQGEFDDEIEGWIV